MVMLSSPVQPSRVPLWHLAKYFLWLGSIGFGGPLALVGYMRQHLSEERNWISRSDFLSGLALASLCPGPFATQLAIYIGWFHARILGATVVLLAFTLPAFLMIVALAITYTNFNNARWAHSAFYGISASVIAIVFHQAYAMSKMIVGHDHWLWGIFLINIIIAYIAPTQIYWFFLISGMLVWLIKVPPRFLTSPNFLLPLGWGLGELTIENLSNHHILMKLFLYFAWTGTVVFGSGFAIIPFIHEGVVQQHHWLTERQFLDAISFGMITPGPIVLAVAFIGYLVAGLKGAIVAAIGIFLPCYLCVIALAPHFNRIAHHEAVRACVQGVTVAVAGGITGTTFFLGKNTIIDWPTLGIFLGTSFALFRFKNIPQPTWLLIAAIIGILLQETAGLK